MGIIIIDPPKKPKEADALSDAEWSLLWQYCSLHAQTHTRIKPKPPYALIAACSVASSLLTALLLSLL